MFKAMSFTKARKQSQCNYSYTDKWIMNMCWIYKTIKFYCYKNITMTCKKVDLCVKYEGGWRRLRKSCSLLPMNPNIFNYVFLFDIITFLSTLFLHYFLGFPLVYSLSLWLDWPYSWCGQSPHNMRPDICGPCRFS